MKAIVLESAENPIIVKEVAKPTPGPGEVLVQIKAAALNRRDWWITQGKYAGIKYPTILGADGAGIVTETGEGAGDWLGKEVIINPSHNWGESPEFQGKDFKILGLPNDGTLADYVLVKAEYLYPKPAHLTFEQAAALPLAGLTAYRALFTKAQLKKGDKVLVVGVGAGTGSFTLQFAVAAGAQVFVTSGSGEKIEQAKQLGAAAGVNYKAQDWAEELKHLSSGGFDVVVDSALGPDFNKIPDLCRPGGRIVFFGGTAGNIPELNARPIFWKQLQILGTTMGTDEDFKAMLAFVDQYRIVPVIDEVFPLADAKKAFDKMGASKQFGKLVITP
ncbi:zinc-binding dehydrogenase [Mucilaginibacter phyllosphaerae]|uniref:Alcohol dehydrogenase n=1 Tax=Mucilaginibacter phyllosphaerae TaxID=1812349 RepID=A0A4Y8A804_9SPHI|nr:zinc-binding dehydrogenase [Mucilaginibacter phyllosphaerae]MBB3971125.1 NADPH:quinone reductase-like Zn-dependent oxidoreductase [Mucilaginibacter phyllosphaerae]TEW63855.1 alcohol dehydrogenase [Mucilaginibacter phyllosphaerae]GGH22624.1 alcohol dehydrogenase [Mucilaginibacter phyllosphaerae]